jgi:formylglycine-generating enzyme required for sulfatase activity
MGVNPSKFKNADNPVENVSWDDCQEFLKKLNALPSVKKSGLKFRLPFGMEWEYACRAGSTGDYCKLADGTEITGKTLGEVAWCDGKAHPVGQKKPNAFGLYDMNGSVQEWCDDLGKYNWKKRELRGGSWSHPYTAGYWNEYSPDFRTSDLGFRLAAD